MRPCWVCGARGLGQASGWISVQPPGVLEAPGPFRLIADASPASTWSPALVNGGPVGPLRALGARPSRRGLRGGDGDAGRPGPGGGGGVGGGEAAGGRPSPGPRCGPAGRAGSGLGRSAAPPRAAPRPRPRPEPRRGPAGCEPGARLGLRRLRPAGAAGRFRGDVPSDRLPQRHDGAGAQRGAGPNSRHSLQPPAAPAPGPRWPLPDPFPGPVYSLDPGRPGPSEPAVGEGKPAQRRTPRCHTPPP